MAIGFCIIMAGILLAGTDKLIGYENTALFAILGLALFGVGLSFITIPCMPEILEGIEMKKTSFDETQLQNNVSGYFIVAQGLGETFGPLSSALIEKQFGDFRST